MPYTVSINIFNKYIHLNEPGIVKKTKKKTNTHKHMRKKCIYRTNILFLKLNSL